jgi:hypothetical protein
MAQTISAALWVHMHRWWNAVREKLRGGNLELLERRLNDPAAYTDGMLKLTRRQFRALKERNRRVEVRKGTAAASPLLVWVEGRGLCRAVRKD